MEFSNTEAIIKHLFDISNEKCLITDEMILKEPNGEMQTILTGLLMLSENIELKKKQLVENLLEKETLIDEVHHRVKNNLQVVISLLSLQSGIIEDDKTKNLFRSTQYRINSMAMIHELLYKSESFSKINFKNYIKSLATELISSMKGPESKIDLTIDSPDFNLNLDTAIPLGLIINEVITNSLKYGIYEMENGQINIQIKKLDYPNFFLTISDNGKGFSNDINQSTVKSLGLKLIHQLSRQLKGCIEKDNKFKGTKYILSFKEIQ